MSRLRRHVGEDFSDFASTRALQPGFRYLNACLDAAARTDAAMARVIRAWFGSQPGPAPKVPGGGIVIEFPRARSKRLARKR